MTDPAGIDEKFMREALALARAAEAAGEVPVGALIVVAGVTLASGRNSPIESRDPTAHAEMNAIRGAAAKTGNYRLTDATLYVTLEPCAMCLGAMYLARIRRLVFGAEDPKTGAVGGCIDLTAAGLPHTIDVVGGVLAAQCGALLREFFIARRGPRRGQ